MRSDFSELEEVTLFWRCCDSREDEKLTRGVALPERNIAQLGHFYFFFNGD